MDYGSVLVAPHTKYERLVLEKPLHSLTRMAKEAKGMTYWERLQLFNVFSNKRQIERYRILYLWKSLKGYVPSLGICKQIRDLSKLAFPKLHGKEGAARILLIYSLRWERVRIYNALPKYLREWEGSKKSFKNKLDQFLSLIPDEPEQRGLTQNRSLGQILSLSGMNLS